MKLSAEQTYQIYRNTFGAEGIVYPGHPVCFAYIIMHKYDCLAEALTKPEGREYNNALRDENLPGAGGNVWAALDVLKHAELTSPEAAFEVGSDYWRRCASGANYGKNQAAGQAQADAIKDAFLTLAAKWSKPSSPSADK